MAEPEKKIQTLTTIYGDDRILLGLKKRGLGTGRWNGFGGNLEPGETVEAAARREVREEAGVEVTDLKPRGMLRFRYLNSGLWIDCHLFSASKFTGEPAETQEMRPRWFDQDKIPYAEMWPDDKYWLPLILAGKNVRGEFIFKDENELIEHTVEEI